MKCVVVTDSKARIEATEFITVLPKEDGDTSVVYHTDTLSMGIAAKMLYNIYAEMLEKETEESRAEISKIVEEGEMTHV